MLAKPGSAAAAPRSRRPPLCAPSQAAVESPVAVTRAAAAAHPQTCCGNAPVTVLRVYHRAFSHRRRLASKPDLFPLQKRASAAQHNGAADITSGQQSPRDEDDFLRSVSLDHLLRRWRHEPPRLGRSNSDGKSFKIKHAQGSCRPPSDDSQHQLSRHERNFRFATRPNIGYQRNRTERASGNKIEIGSLPSKTMEARRNLWRILDQLRLRHRERVGREHSGMLAPITVLDWLSEPADAWHAPVPTCASKNNCAPSWEIMEGTWHLGFIQNG